MLLDDGAASTASRLRRLRVHCRWCLRFGQEPEQLERCLRSGRSMFVLSRLLMANLISSSHAAIRLFVCLLFPRLRSDRCARGKLEPFYALQPHRQSRGRRSADEGAVRSRRESHGGGGGLRGGKGSADVVRRIPKKPRGAAWLTTTCQSLIMPAVAAGVKCGYRLLPCAPNRLGGEDSWWWEDDRRRQHGAGPSCSRTPPPCRHAAPGRQ